MSLELVVSKINVEAETHQEAILLEHLCETEYADNQEWDFHIGLIKALFNNNWGKTVGLLTQRRFMDAVREDMQRTAVAEEDAGDRVRSRHGAL